MVCVTNWISSTWGPCVLVVQPPGLIGSEGLTLWSLSFEFLSTLLSQSDGIKAAVSTPHVQKYHKSLPFFTVIIVDFFIPWNSWVSSCLFHTGLHALMVWTLTFNDATPVILNTHSQLYQCLYRHFYIEDQLSHALVSQQFFQLVLQITCLAICIQTFPICVCVWQKSLSLSRKIL